MTMLTGNFMQHGYSLIAAQHAALGGLDQILMGQVAAKSYNTTFFLLLIVSLATTPAVFLLRIPKAGEGAGRHGALRSASMGRAIGLARLRPALRVPLRRNRPHILLCLVMTFPF